MTKRKAIVIMEYKVRPGKHFFKTRFSCEAESSIWELLCIYSEAMDLRVLAICAPESIFSGANSIWPVHFRGSFQGLLRKLSPSCFPKLPGCTLNQTKPNQKQDPSHSVIIARLQENSCDYKVWEADHTHFEGFAES